MSSAPEPSKTARLISQLLLEDASLRDIVQEFVDGLGARLDELNQAHGKLDWEMLTTLAHRLKGAAGSYGYPDISSICADMEFNFRAHHAENFQECVQRLNDLVIAARAGLDTL